MERSQLRRLLQLFLVGALVFCAHAVRADGDRAAVTKIEQIAGSTPEAVRRVPNARIAIANYDAIRRDFPEVRNATPAEIDRWLLRSAGYISTSQTAPNRVNEPFFSEPAPDHVKAHRPPFYNRGLVFETEGGRLLDGKGFGSRNPGQYSHGNGLASLGEMLREHLFHEAVGKVMRHSQTGFDALTSYAVIDFGFDIIGADGKRSPAGAILREPHERPNIKFGGRQSNPGFLGNTDSHKAEYVLRRYGIASGGATFRNRFDARGKKIDLANVQGDISGRRLFDFGSYRVEPSFPARPVHNIGSSNAGDLHKPFFTPPGVPGPGRFPQPDSNVSVPANVWGIASREGNQKDFVELEADAIAVKFARGQVGRAELESFQHEFLDPIDEKLAGKPPPKFPGLEPRSSSRGPTRVVTSGAQRASATGAPPGHTGGTTTISSRSRAADGGRSVGRVTPAPSAMGGRVGTSR